MKERLIEFLAYLGVGQNKFEEKIGLSRGFVNKIGDAIREKNLQKISNVYPELDIDWLKTGAGEMLHHHIGHTTLGDNSPINGDIEINTCKAALGMANTKIEYLEQRLKDKDEIIELLKKQIK
jgi:hypothetical protein